MRWISLHSISLWLVATTAFGASLDERIDRMFRAYDRAGVPGASVGVYKDGEIIYEKGYGEAELAASRATTVTTNYRLASVSKAFTAMAVMILVERGQLSYDQTLTEILPDFPSYGRRITIRHLLNHTSGLRDYENHIPPGRTTQLKDADVVDILKRQSSTYFTPGTSYRYSNSGYATLAHIVSVVSGVPFSTFLRDEIFLPLGMTNSVAYERGVNEVPERAYGYTQRGSRFDLTDQSMTSAVLGDGGVYTSVREYFLWDQALYTDRLVSMESLAQMFTSGRLANGSRTGYGFGWKLDTYRGRQRVSHTGSTVGFRTAVQRFPEERLTVVVLVNRANSSPWNTAQAIADLFLQ